MPFRVRFEQLFPSFREVDLSLGYIPLFLTAMRDNHHSPALEEIEDAVVNALIARSEFVDVIAKVIRFGPPQFVPKLL